MLTVPLTDDEMVELIVRGGRRVPGQGHRQLCERAVWELRWARARIAELETRPPLAPKPTKRGRRG
jgi:hypothetical protein